MILHANYALFMSKLPYPLENIRSYFILCFAILVQGVHSDSSTIVSTIQDSVAVISLRSYNKCFDNTERLLPVKNSENHGMVVFNIPRFAKENNRNIIIGKL